MIFEGNYNLSKMEHKVHGDGRFSTYSFVAGEYRSMKRFPFEEGLQLERDSRFEPTTPGLPCEIMLRISGFATISQGRPGAIHCLIPFGINFILKDKYKKPTTSVTDYIFTEYPRPND